MKVREDWDIHDRQDHAGFFINPDECVHCGCCHAEAPRIFAWRDAYSGDLISTVSTQPRTDQEIAGALNAMRICMVECIYYAGNDPELMARVKAIPDLSDACLIHFP